MNVQKMKRYAVTIGKLGLVAGLLYWMAQKGLISPEVTARAFRRLDLFLPTCLFLLATNLLSMARWHWLLTAQGIRITLGHTVQLSFIGSFFNVMLPGAVSGDFVKAYYVGIASDGRRGHAFGSILFDRVVGLSALALVSATALALEWDELKGTPVLSALRLFVASAAIAVVCGLSYLFLLKERHDPVFRLLNHYKGRGKLFKSLFGIYEGIRSYHSHRLISAGALVISAGIHAAVCLSFYWFAKALEIDLPFQQVFVVVPLGLLITAIPVAPAGIGTGHAGFLWLFGLLGTNRGADLFTLFVLNNLFTAAIGGIAYLAYRSRHPHAGKEFAPNANG